MSGARVPPLGRWVMPLGPDGPRDRLVFSGSLVHIGEFRCEPGGPGWGHRSRAGPHHMVVFPGPAVVIRQEGRGAAVANRTTAIFYEPGQEFRREPLEGRGDHCIHVSMSARALAGILGAAGLEADQPQGFAFPSVSGPVSSAAFLLQRRVGRYVLAEPDPDPLLVEEAMIRVLGSVVAGAFALRRSDPAPTRAVTRARHEESVLEAGAFLTRRLADRVSMHDVARAAHLSEFHLARLFRATTGFTLHGYRHHLRLRQVVERLLVDRAELIDVAAEAGFSSHAHLTDSFRRAFGRPPSAVRSASDVAEVRRILETSSPTTP